MKKLRILASLCAAAICVSLTGCGDTSWAIKTDSVTIPTGVYSYYLLSNASTLQQMATVSAASAASAASSSTTKSTANKSSDIWSQTVSGTGAVTWAMNSALEECKDLAVIEKLCKAKKVSLSSDQTKSTSSQAESSYTQYKDLWSKNDISQTSLQRIVSGMYLKQLLFKAYYGEGGEKAVAASDIEKYYTENFVHVKQIYVSKFDSSYQTLTGDALTKAKNKANKAYADAKADPSKFDSFVKTYNEDPGMTSNPTGYILSKKTAAASNYDSKFTNLAYSLKDGEVGMAESDMGWFIEMKIKIDPKDTATYTESQKFTVLSEMKSEEFSTFLQNEIKKTNFQKNDNALNKYSPKNLKLS